MTEVIRGYRTCNGTAEKAKKLQASLLADAKRHEKHIAKQRREAIKMWEANEDGHPSGYLRKPDFKKADILSWERKRGDVKYQKRWFLLKDGVLQYYKTKPTEDSPGTAKTRKKRASLFGDSIQKGEVILYDGTVKEVRLSTARPTFALDIVTNTHLHSSSRKQRRANCMGDSPHKSWWFPWE